MKKQLTVLLFVLLPSILNAQSGIVNEKSKGVVVYVAEPGDRTITIYKKDGTRLRRLLMNDYLFRDLLLSPFVMWGEYNLLVFDCIGTTVKDYIVIANDKTKLIGYIRKSDPLFKFETWSQHIVLHIAAVDFNVKSNPLHRLPDAKSPVIKFDSEEAYSPKSVKGNWLRVVWGYPKESSGWIRWWDDKHKLLVGIYYVM